MTDRKMVISIYPNAHCIIYPTPTVPMYSVVFGGTATWFFRSGRHAWKQARERIFERMIAKLEQ
jgi:hypothetical protein